jgi:hypothetical protein
MAAKSMELSKPAKQYGCMAPAVAMLTTDAGASEPQKMPQVRAW